MLAHVGCACAPWRVSRPWARARVPSITSRDPGIRLHCWDRGVRLPGHPLICPHAHLGIARVALTCDEFRATAYGPAGAGSASGRATARPSARTRGYRYSPWEPNTCTSRFQSNNPRRGSAAVKHTARVSARALNANDRASRASLRQSFRRSGFRFR